MKKVLFVATVYKFFRFEKSDMQILKEMGFEIHTASNMNEAKWLQDDGLLDNLDVVKHQIDFGRSPFSKQSIRAYKQIKIVINSNNYDMIHMHTPVAAAIARVAAKSAKKNGTKIIYTSHGFHFHKNSSWKDWIFYYSIEKLLAPLTDMIITINTEDYSVIQKFNVRYKKYIPGVGIDYNYIANIDFDRNAIRKEIGVPQDSICCLCIGELSDRKNQSVLIKAIAELKNNKIYLILCGAGDRESEYRELIDELSVNNNVLLLGQRDYEWVMRLCHAIDFGAIPSKIEGLGLAGLEMMAAGKPVIGSNVHGIKDYVITNKTGISCSPENVQEIKNAMNKLISDYKYYHICSENALHLAKKFDINIIKKLMKENYSVVLEDNK